jgi:hypothetical protein
VPGDVKRMVTGLDVSRVEDQVQLLYSEALTLTTLWFPDHENTAADPSAD